MEHKIVEARHAASTGNAGVLDFFGSDLLPAVGGATNQLIGLRFDGLDIPTDPVIVNAQIGLNGDDAGNDGTWSFTSGDFADLTGSFAIGEFGGSDIPGIGTLADIFNPDATDTAINSLPMDLVWIERPDLDPNSSSSPEMIRRADPGDQFDPRTIPIDQSSDPIPVVDRPAFETGFQGGDLQVTTTGSDVPIVTIGEIVLLEHDSN